MMGEPVQGKISSRSTAQIPNMNHLQLLPIEVGKGSEDIKHLAENTGQGEEKKEKKRIFGSPESNLVSHLFPPWLEQLWAPYHLINTVALFLMNKLYNFTSAYTSNKNKLS